MAKRLSMYKVLDLREEYLMYVYNKYVYNIFNNYDNSKSIKLVEALKEHNSDSNILQEYLNNVQLSISQKEVLSQWNEEIYGIMHIVGFSKRDNKVFLYCEDTDDIYLVDVCIKQLKSELSMVPYYTKVFTAIFPLYGKRYLDSISLNLYEDIDLEERQDLYEHIYELTKQKDMLQYVPSFFSDRNTKNYNLADIFLDYVNVMSLTTLDYDHVYFIVQQGVFAWNMKQESDLASLDDLRLDEENKQVIKFLFNRKKQYFSNYNEYIMNFDLNIDYGIHLGIDVAESKE